MLATAIVVTMIYGARCEKTFKDFNLKLDDVSVFALFVVRWLWNYWYVLVLMLLPALLVEGIVLFVLHRSKRTRVWSYVIALLGVLLILLFSGCMGYGLYEPYTKLLDALSR